MPAPVGVDGVDRRVGAGELGEALAAAAARRGQAAVDAIGDDADRGDATGGAGRAGGDHGGDRRGLGAPALGVGGVLHVGAGMDGAGLGAHGGADREVRIGCVGTPAHSARPARTTRDPCLVVLLPAAKAAAAVIFMRGGPVRNSAPLAAGRNVGFRGSRRSAGGHARLSFQAQWGMPAAAESAR